MGLDLLVSRFLLWVFKFAVFSFGLGCLDIVTLVTLVVCGCR